MLDLLESPLALKSASAFEFVPVVQRIERRFPKDKTVFLLEFADVSSSEQMTIFKRIE
jgi:hypothetical protein